MGTVHSRHPTMNCLVVLSCVLAAAQGAAVLPYAGLGYGYAGLGYGYAGLHAVPAVAKSTIKYETHAFEPVDVATPADAVKIELVTKEHEQEVLTPTYTYATQSTLSPPPPPPPPKSPGPPPKKKKKKKKKK